MAEATHRVYYTDGSKADANCAAWGVSVWAGQKEVEAYNGKVSGAEVFDAELFALSVALVIAGQKPRALVLSDSQAAIQAVVKGNSTSSQGLAIQARAALGRGDTTLN